MPKPRKESLPPEEVRQQVNQVMARWQSYPSFASLLDDLMQVNGLSDRALAKILSSETRKSLSTSAVSSYRHGELDPPYSFIEDLLTSNPLHLDPGRIQPAGEGHQTGGQRLALFASAGLVEVTPESICEWNREVLASHCRRIETSPSIPQPRWGDLMSKLLAFHRQGGRELLLDIAENSTTDNRVAPASRLVNLLCNQHIPTERERLALASYLGLDNQQVAYIEGGIASGTILLGAPDRRTPFAAALNRIFDKLTAQGISLRQLALLCAEREAPGANTIQQSQLSQWRYGRCQITLQALRSLTAGLKQLGPQRLSDPVTSDEITNLIAVAGYAPNDLSDTTHEIIARLNDNSQVKPLLSALRYAPDVAIAANELLQEGKRLGFALPTLNVFTDWHTATTVYPTGNQVRELLRCYNHFILRNGFTPLSDEEITKAVKIADRSYESWHQLPHADKLAWRKPRDKRRPPSASFDSDQWDR